MIKKNSLPVLMLGAIPLLGVCESSMSDQLMEDLACTTETARYTKQNIDYTPYIVSVLTHKEFSRLAVTNLQEALNLVPGTGHTDAASLSDVTRHIAGANYRYALTPELYSGAVIKYIGEKKRHNSDERPALNGYKAVDCSLRYEPPSSPLRITLASKMNDSQLIITILHPPQHAKNAQKLQAMIRKEYGHAIAGKALSIITATPDTPMPESSGIILLDWDRKSVTGIGPLLKEQHILVFSFNTDLFFAGTHITLEILQKTLLHANVKKSKALQNHPVPPILQGGKDS